MDIRFGVGVGTGPPLSRTHAALRGARLAGFDSAWVVDHFLGFFPEAAWQPSFTWLAKGDDSPHAYFDWQTLLGDLAGRAGSLRLGVGVTEATRRHPVLIAQAAMTLSHLTKRAPIIGIGAGERENTEPYGLDFDRPVGRLEEALAIIRTCFSSSGPFEFRGEHFSMPDAVMDIRPAAGRMPELWVAAHGPRTLALTGRFGDGWYPTHPMRPAEYADALATIARAATASGRDPADITPAAQVSIVVGRTEARARAMLAHPAIRFLGLLAPASLWEAAGRTHPLGPGFRGMVDLVPQRLEADDVWDAIEQVEADFLAEHIVWGDRRRVARALLGLVEAGLRHVVLQPTSGLVSRGDALFTLRSLPAIRDLVVSGEA